MTAYIGIDYGSKYIGLSWAIQELGVAVPLPAIVRWRSLDQVMHQLHQIKNEKTCDAFVLGLPVHMNGHKGKRVEEVKRFAELLQQTFHLPIYWMDERLTTYAAQIMFDIKPVNAKHAKQKKHSGIVDSRAASIILQDFLNSNTAPLG